MAITIRDLTPTGTIDAVRAEVVEVTDGNEVIFRTRPKDLLYVSARLVSGVGSCNLVYRYDDIYDVPANFNDWNVMPGGAKTSSFSAEGSALLITLDVSTGTWELSIKAVER